MSLSFPELEKLAGHIRFELVKMSHRAGTAHLGGALSCVDILVATYWGALNVNPQNPNRPGRDRLILSKGHAISALYATLAVKGFFPISSLEEYNRNGGHLPEQPSPGCAPGVEWATGSLGHGLSVGIGMALAGRIQGRKYRVVVVMSDGECEEGSVWEAAMFASKHGLTKLMAIIDYNKWQATGRSNEIMALDPLKSKWEAFGWRCYEVDGHDLRQLVEACWTTSDQDGKPIAIVAHTVKGKGISFIEDDNNWHYRSPTTEEVMQAAAELKIS
jgi:transketolase